MAKVTKTKMDAIIKNCRPDAKTVTVTLTEDKTVEIHVDPNVSLESFADAVQELAEMQFATDKKTGKEFYAPYLVPFAEWYVLLKYFTDVDVALGDGGAELSDKVVERLWALRKCRTDNDLSLKIEVLDAVGTIWHDLTYAASELVEDRRERIKASPARIWEGLAGVVRRLDELTGKLTPEDLKELLEKLADTGSDTGKVIPFPSLTGDGEQE